MADVSQNLRLNVIASNNATGMLTGLSTQARTTFGTAKSGSVMSALKGVLPSGGLTGVAGAALVATTGVAAIGLAVGGVSAAFSKIVGDSSNFQQKMAEVKAVTGATTEEMESLRAIALKMGEQTKFSATEAADGLQFLGMAGLSVQQSIQALPDALNLAAAGNLALGEAADIATNIMSGMGLTVDNLPHLMNVLAATASSSNTDIRGLGEAFSYAASTASSVGWQVEDVSTALAAMASNGQSGSRGGIAVAAALSQMVDPSDKAAKRMKELNLELVNANGTVVPLTEVVDQLSAANLTAADRIQIFGERGSRAISAFLNAGKQDGKPATEAIREMRDSLVNVGNVAQQMAETQMATLQGAMTELGSAMEGLSITVGTPFLGFLEEGVRLTTDLVRETNELAKGVVESGDKIEESQPWIAALVQGLSNGMIQAGAFNAAVEHGDEVLAAWAGQFIGTKRAMELFGVEIDEVRPKIDLAVESLEELEEWSDPTPIRIPFDPVIIRPSRPDVPVDSLGDYVDEVIDEVPDPKPIRIPFDSPEVNETAVAIRNTLDSAFTQAVGTLIRTGSLKDAAEGLFFNVLDSAIGNVAKRIGTSLSNMFMNAISGMGGDGGFSLGGLFGGDGEGGKGFLGGLGDSISKWFGGSDNNSMLGQIASVVPQAALVALGLKTFGPPIVEGIEKAFEPLGRGLSDIFGGGNEGEFFTQGTVQFSKQMNKDVAIGLAQEGFNAGEYVTATTVKSIADNLGISFEDAIGTADFLAAGEGGFNRAYNDDPTNPRSREEALAYLGFEADGTGGYTRNTGGHGETTTTVSPTEAATQFATPDDFSGMTKQDPSYFKSMSMEQIVQNASAIIGSSTLALTNHINRNELDIDFDAMQSVSKWLAEGGDSFGFVVNRYRETNFDYARTEKDLRRFLSTYLKIPEFDVGGIVPGPIGSPQLAVVHGGETVLPTHDPSFMGGGKMGNEIHLHFNNNFQSFDANGVRQIVQGEFMEIIVTRLQELGVDGYNVTYNDGVVNAQAV